MRTGWTHRLCLSLGLLAGSVHAQEYSGPSNPPRPLAASLGRPVPLQRSVPVEYDDPLITPIAYRPPAPPSNAPVSRTQATDTGPTLRNSYSGLGTPTPAGPTEPYNCGVVTDPPAGPAAGPGFWSKCTGWFQGAGASLAGSPDRALFQSDHCFDGFISPVSSPFLFEDPRSLTEARLIFMQQGTPKNQYVFGGNSLQYFGLQARVALTDRLSFVMNKAAGGVWTEPANHIQGFSNTGGFSEIWLGPKYTFLRSENSGTLGAAGLVFQIPAGSSKVFQHTGNLGLAPYISLGQNFGRTSYGSFNALSTTGYDFSTTTARSEYIYTSLHLDYDLFDAHKFYPLVETTFWDYTRAGNATNLGFEGYDIFNFGSQGMSGHKYWFISPGFRYKPREWIQTGIAVDLPLLGTRDLLQYRITWDLIFRY